MSEILSKSGMKLFTFDGSLVGQTFDGKDLSEADFSQRDLEGVSFDEAMLSNATFSRSSLYWVSFFYANLSKCCFSEATLAGVDFKHAMMRESIFLDAKIIRDKVSLPTDFRGADLTNACFEGAVVDGALIDSSTKFAEDVVPLNLGFCFAEEGD